MQRKVEAKASGRVNGYGLIEQNAIHSVWEHMNCGHQLTMKPDKCPANAGLCERCGK